MLGWQGQSVQFSPSPPSCAGAWDTSGPGDPETHVRRGCKNTRNVLGPCLLLVPCPLLVPDPVPGGEQGRCPPPAQSLPSRLGNVQGTFFQTLVVILVLQEREVTVLWMCRRENCWEPHAGQGGLAPPEESVLAFLKCPRVQLLPSIHLTMGLGAVLSHGHSPMDTSHG